MDRPKSARKTPHDRPVCWENDFSINNLDENDFLNNAPPADRGMKGFGNWRNHIPDELIPGDEFAEWVSRDHYPIPAAADRENYMPDSDTGYWMSGLGDFLKVMKSARECDIAVGSVLDFGCSTGRVTRHFCIQENIPDVWGTDLNQRHIRWLSRFMPRNLKPVFNSAMPTLPLSDQSVDVICAFSVFTHIDTFETAWLAELRRILKPGGLCYLTVHNEDTWSSLGAIDESNRLLSSMIGTGKFTMDMLQGPMPGERLVYRFSEIGPYRAQVFHSNAYLENTWGRFFDIEDILPLYHHRQSVVVMKKPSMRLGIFGKAAA